MAGDSRAGRSSLSIEDVHSDQIATPCDIAVYHWERLCPGIGFSHTNVRRYLCAEHGYKANTADRLSLSEIAEVLRRADQRMHRSVNASSRPDEESGRQAGFLSSGDLAKRYTVPLGALDARLRRWRNGHWNDWHKTSDVARNEPRYLYKVSAVMAIIDKLRRKFERTD